MPTPESNNARAAFSSRLKTLRKTAGFRSARAFATQLGIDENRYTRYERAEVEPSFSLFVTMCEALRVTPNELLGYEPGSFAQSDSGDLRTAGFADRAAQDDYDGLAAPRQESTASTRAGAAEVAASARIAAWRLAQVVVGDGRCALDAGELDDVAAMQAVSERYDEITSDPFGFAARLFASNALARVEPTERAEMVRLLKVVTDTALRQAVGQCETD